MEYCCDKCSLQGSFRTVIEHFIADHPLHNLVISRRILNHLTAKMARQSDFAIVLQDTTKSGGKLVIDDVSKKVRDTSTPNHMDFTIMDNKQTILIFILIWHLTCAV